MSDFVVVVVWDAVTTSDNVLDSRSEIEARNLLEDLVDVFVYESDCVVECEDEKTSAESESLTVSLGENVISPEKLSRVRL